MSHCPFLLRDKNTFHKYVSDVAKVFDTSKRFPELPFVTKGGHVSILDFDSIASGEIALMLPSLMDCYGDSFATCVVLDPDPDYLFDLYGSWPGFRMLRDGIENEFLKGMQFQPEGHVSGAICMMDVMVVTGSSNLWGWWAQRDWEFGVLSTPDADGPWMHLDTDMQFFERSPEALDSFRSPEGWGISISDDMYTRFFSEIISHERG